MIGFLSGVVKSINGPEVIVLVGGVGYTVLVPSNQPACLDQSIQLYIHTHVREDTLALYGFPDRASLVLFEKLISVSGVGPKSALAIISAGETQTIKKAIEATNLSFFTSISGIGKKSAQKIIIELRSKLAENETNLEELEGKSQLAQALTQLGFSKFEITSAVSQVAVDQELQDQIKQALKLLR